MITYTAAMTQHVTY